MRLSEGSTLQAQVSSWAGLWHVPKGTLQTHGLCLLVLQVPWGHHRFTGDLGPGKRGASSWIGRQPEL